MDQTTAAWCSAFFFGLLPLLLYLIWYWNDIYFFSKLRLRDGLIKRSGNWANNGLLPGYMGLPFLGETPAFLWYFKFTRRPDDFIDSKRKKYGDGVGMYRSHLFGKPTIISCTPESNKFVLQSPDEFPLRWNNPDLVGMKSMFNVEKEQHARTRGFVVNAINKPDSLRRIANVLQPRVVAALRSWTNKGTIIAYQEIKKMTFGSICKMFISLDPGPLQDELNKYFSGVVPGIRAYPLYLPGTAYYNAVKCRQKLEAKYKKEVERRQRSDSGNEINETKDLLDGLMELKDEEGKGLTNEEVVDNIVSLVIGGYESVTLSSTWALYLLSKSPDVLQRLREENVEVAQRKKGQFLTPEEMTHMKYTAKVVEESIRMANVAAMGFRVAQRDVVYKGFRIPKGWQIAVWFRSLHTDPRYFDDPFCFNPDRWNVPAKPGTYQVFGGGPRICAGNMLARLQLTIILHHVALGYKWKLVNPDARIKYLPHPLPVDGAVMEFRTLDKE